jgi:Cytochrome P450
MSSVLGYERKIQEILSRNWARFGEFAASKKSVDMDHWATYFAYDIITELALGNALGMVQKGGDVNRVMESVLGLFYFASNMGHVPWQNWWMTNPVSTWLIANLGTESMKGTGMFRKWLTDSVAKRYYGNEKPNEKDMLQNFIEAKDRDGNPNTFFSVLSECGNVLGVCLFRIGTDL